MHGGRAFVESQALFFVSLHQRWFVDNVLLVVMVVFVVLVVFVVVVDVIDNVLVDFGVLELVFFSTIFTFFISCSKSRLFPVVFALFSPDSSP